jgi:hypothetical protein
MRLIKLTNINPEVGNCFLATLEDNSYEGERLGDKRKSGLILFENGIELMPSSATHNQIRILGNGSYSHWGNYVYFSSSDNSDPRANGREYAALIPTSLDEEKKVEALAFTKSHEPDFFRAVLTGSISKQGAELHAVYTFRALCMYAKLAQVSIQDAKILEIGASPTSGLALCLGLAGARHIILNNIIPIELDIDANFARNISLLTALVTPQVRSLDEVVDFSPNGKSCRLKSSLYSVLDNIDAQAIPRYFPDEHSKVDLIFSFSVLEHIRSLPEVLAALANISSPKTVGIHMVDARDHTDFSNPLKYLYLSEDQFNANYSPDNNRWRLPDYVTMMSESGWLVRQTFVLGSPPTLSNGNTDMYQAACRGPEVALSSSPNDLPRIISTDEIKNLDEEFSNYTEEELSIVIFCLICSLTNSQ